MPSPKLFIISFEKYLKNICDFCMTCFIFLTKFCVGVKQIFNPQQTRWLIQNYYMKYEQETKNCILKKDNENFSAFTFLPNKLYFYSIGIRFGIVTNSPSDNYQRSIFREKQHMCIINNSKKLIFLNCLFFQIQTFGNYHQSWHVKKCLDKF